MYASILSLLNAITAVCKQFNGYFSNRKKITWLFKCKPINEAIYFMAVFLLIDL